MPISGEPEIDAPPQHEGTVLIVRSGRRQVYAACANLAACRVSQDADQAHQCFRASGAMPISLAMIVNITSSAPPPMEVRRESRKYRDTGVSFM